MQADGRETKPVEVENCTAKVKRKGACNDCTMSTMILQRSVVNCIKEGMTETKNGVVQ